MAVDTKWAKKKWATRQEAERKKAKQGVKVKSTKTSSGDLVKDAEKLLEKTALKAVVHAIPSSQRKNWPRGNCERTEVATGHQFEVILQHKNGKDAVTGRIILVRRFLTSEADIKAAGKALAGELIRNLKTYQRGRDDAATDEYEKEFMKKRFLKELLDREKAAEKIIKAARPVCELCGKTDDKFPDWGPCPHEKVTA